MRLHAIYRSTGPDNAKPRPAYHSKLTSLRSFLRAWDAVEEPGSLVFLNDGPIPAERLALMHGAGRVEAREGLELHGSLWEALSLACALPDEDLVLFAEDDYLYRSVAFTAMVDAAGALPGFSYFATYASTSAEMPNGEPLGTGLRVPRVAASQIAPGWVRGLSHTSSFAARVPVIRRDARLHRIGPRCSGTWDHALALAYQGLVPYGPRGIVNVLGVPRAGTLSRRAKAVVWRCALTAGAIARRRSPSLLAAARPCLCTHVESGVIALGTDWEAEARAAEAYLPADRV